MLKPIAILFTLSLVVLMHTTGCAQRLQDNELNGRSLVNNNSTTSQKIPENMELATFGNGCFWCTEAIFQNLEGVSRVVSGYAGGHVKNPTYKEVCAGTTGHAEVVQITYDPSVITYDELLEVFWKTHDPTTLNRQGNDVGPQYRSAVFYHNDSQKQLAEKYKAALDKSGAWDNPIVTEVVPISNYSEAEGYHQNYYNNNPGQPYCAFLIRPKIEKFKKVFADKLRKNSVAN